MGVSAPLRVGLYLADLRPTMTRSHGIISHAVGLANALPSQLGEDDRLVLLYGRDKRDLLAAALPAPKVEALELPTPASWPGRLRRDHLSAWRWCREAALDVIHFPKGFIPVLPIRSAAVVATVHDDIPIRYVEGQFGRECRSVKDSYFAWATRHALERADRVITVSQFSREALVRHVPSAAPRTSVIQNGVSLPLLPPRPQSEKPRLLVHLGSPRPHKRSLEVVTWTRRFLEEDDRYTLMVTGQLSEAAEVAARHPRIVRRRPLMTAAEVATLLRDAVALLFPSVLEGFGLPPAEAACLGTPSVWARSSAVPEVMGDAPGGFPPDVEDAFMSALRAVTALGDEEVGELGRQFREQYSWGPVARSTLDVYRSVCSVERELAAATDDLAWGWPA